MIVMPVANVVVITQMTVFLMEKLVMRIMNVNMIHVISVDFVVMMVI